MAPRRRRDARHRGPRQPLCLLPACRAATCGSSCRRAGERLDGGTDARVLALQRRAARPTRSSAPPACAGSRSRHRMARPPAGGQGLFRRQPPCPTTSPRRCNCWPPRLRLRAGHPGRLALRPRDQQGRNHLQGQHAGDGRRRQRPAARPVPAPVVQQRHGGRQAGPGLRQHARQDPAAGRPPSSRPNAPTTASLPHWPGIKEGPRADELDRPAEDRRAQAPRADARPGEQRTTGASAPTGRARA